MKILTGEARFASTIITIESISEAQALVDIFARVGGSRSGPRGIADKIKDALLNAYGIAYDRNAADGAVYFKDEGLKF